MKRAWAHLHLPRLRSGAADVISLKTPGEPIRYASYVGMIGVEFKVHEPGRRRCVREGVRNVHAWVVGLPAIVWEGGTPIVTPDWKRAVYDPWKGPAFVDATTLEPLQHAETAVLIGKAVFYQ
ncbi:hypothetical protein ABZ871_38185 [Streptomyces populi]